MVAVDIEMKLFEAAKETENKLRWDAEIKKKNKKVPLPKVQGSD